QAEDGIRDFHVTGVQTCALPIFLAVAKARLGDIAGAQAIFEAQRGSGPQVDRNLAELYVAAGRAGAALELLEPLVGEDPEDARRSEERRVGIECRSRWSREHKEK